MTRARKLTAYASPPLPPPPQVRTPIYTPKPPTPVAQPPSYAPPSKYCASPPGYNYLLPIEYCTPGPVVWEVPTPSPGFFNVIAGPPPVITPLPPGKNHTTVIAVCVSLGGAFLLFLVLGALCFVKKKKLTAAHHEGGGATAVGGYGALKSTGPAAGGTGGGYGAH